MVRDECRVVVVDIYFINTNLSHLEQPEYVGDHDGDPGERGSDDASHRGATRRRFGFGFRCFAIRISLKKDRGIPICLKYTVSSEKLNSKHEKNKPKLKVTNLVGFDKYKEGLR